MPTLLKINGVTFNPITDSCNIPKPTVGVYYALPPYGSPPRIGPEENNWEEIEFPAVDGVWTKDRGFRRRGIQIQLVVIGSSKADAESRYLACQSSFTQRARYTIQFPGGTIFQGCKLVTGQATIISEDAWQGNLCIVVMSCLFVQLSRTNG